MTRRLARWFAWLLLPAALAAQQPAATFSSSVNLVVVDVVVRDRAGTIVRGLTADDFEVLEDGKPQKVNTFDVEEIAVQPAALTSLPPATLTAGRLASSLTQSRSVAAATPVPDPARKADLAGRRLLVLFFDTASMQPDDVERAIRSAVAFVDTQMTPADLVAITSIGTTLRVVSDFTADRSRLHGALASFAATGGIAIDNAGASTMATDEAAADASTDPTEFDTFNNDVRLRALRAVADALAPIEQKKAILYFSSGLQKSGSDNQVELRAAINAAVRANVAIYPIDARGLTAVVPGGDATRASSASRAAFSGRGMNRQLDQLSASQDTLSTLAADTGGQAFLDSNDLGAAFTRAQQDSATYYLLGYNSPNAAKDGRYRKITVRVKRPGLRVEHRNGYYADRDFAHSGRGDRESQLEDELSAAVSATDLPVFAGAGWFRTSGHKYFVPLSVAVAGARLPTDDPRAALDVMGTVRDEQGRTVGRIRETLRVPPVTGGSLASRQVLYQTGLTLPPGRFVLKVVVRENTHGTTGSYEMPLVVPDLAQVPMRLSSVVLSTQTRPATGRRLAGNPLVRDGTELLPSLTHVVDHAQRMFFYYEVYDPAIEPGQSPRVKTSLAFYRGRTKVFETPVVERTATDAADRTAVIFQFEVPAERFAPGLYTCQINVVDDVAGRFVFPRLAVYVR